MCRSQQLFLLQSAEVPVLIDRWWWWWCCVVVVVVVVIVIIYNGWKIRDTDYINLTQPDAHNLMRIRLMIRHVFTLQRNFLIRLHQLTKNLSHGKDYIMNVSRLFLTNSQQQYLFPISKILCCYSLSDQIIH